MKITISLIDIILSLLCFLITTIKKSKKPKEGVVEGQVFESKKISFNRKERYEPGARIKKFMDMNSPQGRWRDDIFDCLNDGITHPMLLLSIFCPLSKFLG